MPVDYEDVEVEVSRSLWQRGDEEQLEVRILLSPFDRPKEPFTRPYRPDELEAFFSEWDKLPIAPGADAARLRKKLAEEIGGRIFQGLFHGKVGKTFGNCLADLSGNVHHRDAGLRIRISFGERELYLPELLGLPWELLYLQDTDTFLGSARNTQIVRYLDTPKRILPLTAEPPLKVLGVLCSPSDENPIDLDKHVEQLQDAVIEQPSIELRFLKHSTLTRLRERLLDDPCHVVHFLGHGAFREDTGEGVLYFERPDGTSHKVTGREVKTQLEGINSLRLVMLNTCEGARMLRHRGQHPFTGVASALVAEGIPAVVAMQCPVSEQAATNFSSTFYARLGKGAPVDEAVAEGRKSILAKDTQTYSFEWATPVLFLRASDGKILDFKTEGRKVAKKVAIFSIEDIGKKATEESDSQVDLTPFFDGRFPKPDQQWNGKVLGNLTRRLETIIHDGHAYQIDFAAPASIAFTTGYLIQAKAGVDVTLPQRGIKGSPVWSMSDPIPADAAAWEAHPSVPDDFPFVPGADDVAVVIEASNPVLPAVGKYLRRKGLQPPTIGHLIYATPTCGPGQTSLQSGGHAYRLAEDLCNRIHAYVSSRDVGTIHIFASAPNALLFFIGRLSRKFPRIQLYEHDFEGQKNLVYIPSITLQHREEPG